MRFVPAYDLDNVPQQIRIVFDNMPGLHPNRTFLPSHSMTPCEICNRLNARLGLDYAMAWSAIAGRVHVRRPG